MLIKLIKKTSPLYDSVIIYIHIYIYVHVCVCFDTHIYIYIYVYIYIYSIVFWDVGMPLLESKLLSLLLNPVEIRPSNTSPY